MAARSCWRENSTSSTSGEGLETDRRAPRLSLSSRQLLFKEGKKDRKIKTLVSTSADALKIQTWTAVVASVMVRYPQPRSRLRWHLSRCVARDRHQLLVYRDRCRLLDNLFEGRLLKVEHLAEETTSGRSPVCSPCSKRDRRRPAHLCPWATSH